jgi:hypothetical protein
MPETEFAGLLIVHTERVCPATGKVEYGRTRNASTAGSEDQPIRNIFPSAGIWIRVSTTGRPVIDWIASA